MPRYEYKARDASGQEARGRTEAASRSACVESLKRRGLRPNSVEEIAPPKLAGKMKSEDLEFFCQQMASMLGAGVSILKTMDSLEATSPNKEIAAVYATIREGLSSGNQLSGCLAAHPELFDSYFVAMVRAGESTGAIDSVFQRLEEHLAFQRDMRASAMKVIRYPLIVAGVMLIALGIINVFVIPAFAKAYAGFGAKLPFFTQLLIATSDFIVSYGLLLLITVGGATWTAIRYGRTVRGAKLYGRWALKMPIFGTLFHKSALARYCAALASAYSCGLPLASSIELVAPACGNAWLAAKLGGMRSALERGTTLTKACSDTQSFRPDALQMLAVGEESGKLDTLLEKVSSLYKNQVEREIEALPPKIEPFMLVMIAGLVLVLALGVFLPMWDLASVAMKGMNK
jgi:MSHA biogenesis protein MshG